MEQSEKIGLYSIGVNLALAGIKFGLSVLSGSVALLADGIHSSTDVISSATVFIGIKLSKRTSKGFPYGLYKVENLVSLVSALLIFLAGYEIVKTAFAGQDNLNRALLPYAILGVLVSMAVTFAFSRYELRQGKALGSPSLIGDAEHIRADLLSSAVILAGLVGGYFGLNLDRLAALVVVVFVFWAGGRILVNALKVLLDASIDFSTLDLVKTTILEDPQVVSINGIWGRNSGRFKFIEADVVLRVSDLDRAHIAGKRIEDKVREKVTQVDHFLIHYEPEKKDTRTCAVPVDGDRVSLSEHFGEAPFFYVATVRNRDNVLLSEAIHHNPFADEEKGKGIKVSEWLIDKGADTVYTPKGFEGRGPDYVFSNGGIEVRVTAETDLETVKQEFLAEAVAD